MRHNAIYSRVTLSPEAPVEASNLGVSPVSNVNMTILGVMVDILLPKHNVYVPKESDESEQRE